MTLLRHRIRPHGASPTASKEKQIRGLAPFRKCSTDELRLIARLADEVDVPAGRVLAHEGQKTRELIFVLDGVAVGSSVAGRTVLLPGGCYGGFGNTPHALQIETVTAVRLLVFPPRVLGSLIACVPSIAPALAVWNSPATSRGTKRARPCHGRGNVRTRLAHPVARERRAAPRKTR
jgi:hypothetical protein